MNALNNYLEANNMTSSDFAKRHGLKQPTIWRIANNKCRPDPDTAKAISEATGGAVTVMELLFPAKSGKKAA